MGDLPRVAVILVNWNGRDVTLECLASLRAATYHPLEILLVDNASTDGSVDSVRKAFPEVTILEMPSNLRFAGGNNAGMRAALERGAEIVVLLNNDTTVDPGFLQPLVDCLRENPGVGMAAPKIFYHAEPDRIWFAGGEISFWAGTMKHTGIRERDRGQYDRRRTVEYATGCCVAVPKRVITTVGMLDESYHIYTEDADWSLRVRRAGYDVVFEPRSRVWHKVSVTSGGHLSWYKMVNKYRSNFRFFARHAHWYHWLTFPWLGIMVNAVAALVYLGQRRRTVTD